MFLAGGICAGMLLGLLKLNAGGVVLGLGTAVRSWSSVSSPAGRAAVIRCLARYPSRRSGC